MKTIQSLKSMDIQNKRVLIREDFNVPQDEAGHITNDVRILEAVPTIQYALSKQARVYILSHLGRPKEGQFEPKYSLKPVAKRLSELLKVPVRLENFREDMPSQPGEVVLIENVRFLKGEAENDPALSKRYASLCDVFVMDAFSVSHRAQASTVGVAEFSKEACAGFLLEKELKALSTALEDPKHPLIAVIGGSKVSTKFKVLDKLLDKVDALIIGGAMANTLLKASGKPIGASMYEEEWIPQAKLLIQKAQDTSKTLMLPMDVVVAKDIHDASGEVKEVIHVSDGDKIFDIGPKTTAQIMVMLQKANTIVWNGPLGVFEFEPFSHGTKVVAKAIAQSHAFSLAGGGDTLAAIEQFGIVEGVSYQSTAGGAFLEFMDGSALPGIEVLKNHAQHQRKQG